MGRKLTPAEISLIKTTLDKMSQFMQLQDTGNKRVIKELQDHNERFEAFEHQLAEAFNKIKDLKELINQTYGVEAIKGDR